MNKLNLKLAGVVAAASLLLAPVANAQLSISFDDGTNSSVQTDAGNTGYVNITSLNLGDWTVKNITGTGDPVLGGSSFDEFDLNSITTSSTSGGTLEVMLTQTDLTRTNAGWASLVGGTSGGNVSFQSWIDTTNTAFGLGTMVSNSGPFSGAFNGVDGGSLSLSGPYSWTMVATIAHATKAVTSFDYNVKIPEPTSLALMGLGLLGAGFASRRKARKTA